MKKITGLLLALSLLLTACGGGEAKAATMRLRKTTGAVGVSDGAGKKLTPAENLGLYSGYGVDTQSESYAWVDLDDVKLTKLDQNSEIEITKEGRHLEIQVLSGSLFFNVTEPLAGDETMRICTSNMVVGIRGTCGWVEVPDEDHMNVYLLEGAVECTAESESAAVTAGEMAAMSADRIVVSAFEAGQIPDFVWEELEEAKIELPADMESGGPDQSWEGPLPLLINQTVYNGQGDLSNVIDYSYDEQGYILREVDTMFPYAGGDMMTSITTYEYDGQGNCWAVYPDGRREERLCAPGSHSYTAGTSQAITDPLISHPDVRSKIGADGRLNYSDFPEGLFEGYYTIYTMDDNGNPVRIETYLDDGTLTGICTMEWMIIEVN